ncbi:MAG: hypothetical protein IKO83_05895 [Oscillospiraceae bacterium]|nr:hypothetical protein [Oscillospiraceae bacterium]
MISAAASRTLRRGVPFFLALVCLLSLFALAFSDTAEASGSYHVKHWKDGSTHYYTVYKGSLGSSYEATFYRDNYDVYSDGSVKITFFWPNGPVSEEQADAFWQYLGKKSSAKRWYCGYYTWTIDEVYRRYDTRYAYKIEGWSHKKSLDSLLKHSPLVNESGYLLWLEDIGYGNLVSDYWDYIRNTRGCSTAVYLPVSDSKDGATVGFRFTNAYGDVEYFYCPD